MFLRRHPRLFVDPQDPIVNVTTQIGCYARRSYTRLASAPRVENVKVTCSANGCIELNIHNPPAPTSTAPILIYLPPTGQTPKNASDKTALPPFLRSWSSPIITLNYRWSSSCLFPTPIHDITIAYDWILSTFFPQSPTLPRRQVGIYGTHLGGILATSLALTENRIGRRGAISVLAVRDAVFDWSPLTQSENESYLLEKRPKKPIMNIENAEAQRLKELMPSLFRNPEAAFDPYASPLLFLRTAGLNVPPVWDADVKSDASNSPSTSMASSGSNGSRSPSPSLTHEFVDDIFEPPVEDLTVHTPARKSRVRFPPRGGGLAVPTTRIESSGNDLLRAQAEEISQLLARSVMVYEVRDSSAYGHVDEGEAEGRVSFADCEVADGDEGEGERTGEWLRNVLG